MTFKPSAYNLAIFNHVAAALDGTANRCLIVEATAGSGKTTQLVELCRRLQHTHPRVRVVVGAFGRRVADELQQKLPSNAEATTLHSLGFRTWRATCPGVEVDLDKVSRIVGSAVDKGLCPRWLRGKLRKLVDLARMHGIVPGWICNAEASALAQEARSGAGGYSGTAGAESLAVARPTQSADRDTAAAVADQYPLRGLVADTDDEWLRLINHYDVGADAPGQLIGLARRTLAQSIRFGHRFVDHADMLYLPTLCSETQWWISAQVLAVDELQDLDGLQRVMIERLVGGVGKGSRCVFIGVGDPQQAIFAWRGADTDSVDRLKRRLAAAELPLSICYRCPSSHLELARQSADGTKVEARPGAPEGVLERYDEYGTLVCYQPHRDGLECDCTSLTYKRGRLAPADPPKLTPTSFHPGDVVISRAKAPLVKFAYWLLRHRVPARILGKDLARDLLSFVDSMKATTVTDLLLKVDRATTRALARAAELDDDKAAEEAVDRQGVVRAVAESYDGDDVPGFKGELEGLFGDGGDRDDVVTCSTIHRMKGGEADRVWWLDAWKMYADRKWKHDWQRVENSNLRFVAATRARAELRLIDSRMIGQ